MTSEVASISGGMKRKEKSGEQHTAVNMAVPAHSLVISAQMHRHRLLIMNNSLIMLEHKEIWRQESYRFHSSYYDILVNYATHNNNHTPVGSDTMAMSTN